MKKILLFLTIALAALSMSARDKYSHDPSVLPLGALTTIKNNCKAAVSLVKIDKELGRVEGYDVILTDGSEIEFDSKGNWKSFEASGKSAVPKAFILKGISDYAAKNFKGVNIVAVEKKHSGYEIELANGMEIQFDSNGTFVRYDK